MTITRKLCEKIVATTVDQMGEAAIAKARQLVLDGVAVAVAGARIEEAPKILAEYLRGQGSKPECAALGFGFRLAPVPAALINATSMHVLDFEPMWTPATHALMKIAATTASPARRSARWERSANAIPSGTAVRASPKLWIRSASSATLPLAR